MRCSSRLVMTVTALSLLSKPMRESDTSLSTIISRLLRESFGSCVRNGVFCFRCETDDERTRVAARYGGDDVRILDQLERDSCVGLLFDLLQGRERGPVISHGGDADEDVAARRFVARRRRASVVRSIRRCASRRLGVGESHRAGDQYDVAPASRAAQATANPCLPEL